MENILTARIYFSLYPSYLLAAVAKHLPSQFLELGKDSVNESMELLCCWGPMAAPTPPTPPLHQQLKRLFRASAPEEAGCPLLTPVLQYPPFQTFSPNPKGKRSPPRQNMGTTETCLLFRLSRNSE